MGTSCSKQGEQQWAKETVFIGGEYCGKTVSGLKTVFIGGEYWGTTFSGLKMGNNSQWAENGFLLKAENGYKRERATAIAHIMATQTLLSKTLLN